MEAWRHLSSLMQDERNTNNVISQQQFLFENEKIFCGFSEMKVGVASYFKGRK